MESLHKSLSLKRLISNLPKCFGTWIAFWDGSWCAGEQECLIQHSLQRQVQTHTNSGRRLRKIQIFFLYPLCGFSLISRDCILKYFHSKSERNYEVFHCERSQVYSSAQWYTGVKYKCLLSFSQQWHPWWLISPDGSFACFVHGLSFGGSLCFQDVFCIFPLFWELCTLQCQSLAGHQRSVSDRVITHLETAQHTHLDRLGCSREKHRWVWFCTE